MHIHLGVQQVIATFASVIAVGFFWRILSAKLHETPLGRAMAFIY